MGVTWKVSPTQAFAGAATRYAEAIRRGVRAIADRWAPEIENYMKSEAKWIDRSGNARQTLNTEVEEVGMDMVRIILAGGVSYQVYLEGFTPEGVETMQGGKYAIIAPAIDTYAPRIWSDVQALLR